MKQQKPFWIKVFPLLKAVLFVVAIGGSSGSLAADEVVAPVVATTAEVVEVEPAVASGAMQVTENIPQHIRDDGLAEVIRAYNTGLDPRILYELSGYLGNLSIGAPEHAQLGRELVINQATIGLHLEVAESVFRGGNIAVDNSLGFIILRLDAGDFLREATPAQRGRFELLLSAILTLPEDRIHRFTRFTAQKSLERIEVAVPSDRPPELLHYLTRRQRFEVLGVNYNAIQSVGAMAQALEQIVADYLPYVDDLPEPLWVRIQMGERRVPAYQLRISENGNVGVVLFWNEEISMDEVAQALSWALLQRIAIWRWGARDEQVVPYWLWRALAAEILPQLQPARNQGLARDIADVQTLEELPVLLNRRAVEGAAANDSVLSLQSLWLYRYLRDQAPGRQMFGLLIEAFLSESDGMVVLQRAFPELAASPEAAQQWWEVGLMNLMHRQQGVVYSLPQSEELVESLSGVTAWWNGQDRRLRGPALLPMRDDPRWQSAFWRKQRELKLELQRINPIYFNSLLSLGQFYDLLLERGGEGVEISAAQLRQETEATYARFLEDWAHARALHRAVEQVLQQEAN